MKIQMKYTCFQLKILHQKFPNHMNFLKSVHGTEINRTLCNATETFGIVSRKTARGLESLRRRSLKMQLPRDCRSLLTGSSVRDHGRVGTNALYTTGNRILKSILNENSPANLIISSASHHAHLEFSSFKNHLSCYFLYLLEAILRHGPWNVSDPFFLLFSMYCRIPHMTITCLLFYFIILLS